MSPFFIHARHIGFIVFISIFQGLIPVFNYFLWFEALLESGNWTQLVEYFMFFPESQSSEEILEIIKIKLTFPTLINNSE